MWFGQLKHEKSVIPSSGIRELSQVLPITRSKIGGSGTLVSFITRCYHMTMLLLFPLGPFKIEADSDRLPATICPLVIITAVDCRTSAKQASNRHAASDSLGSIKIRRGAGGGRGGGGPHSG